MWAQNLLGCRRGTVDPSLLILCQIVHHMVIFLDFPDTTNFGLFRRPIHKRRWLHFLHLKFPLNGFFIVRTLSLVWLQFCLFLRIIGHSETPTLYYLNLELLLLLVGISPILTIDIRSSRSIGIHFLWLLVLYFNFIAQILHLIDFFSLSFSNIHFRYFFCFIVLSEVVQGWNPLINYLNVESN